MENLSRRAERRAARESSIAAGGAPPAERNASRSRREPPPSQQGDAENRGLGDTSGASPRSAGVGQGLVKTRNYLDSGFPKREGMGTMMDRVEERGSEGRREAGGDRNLGRSGAGGHEEGNLDTPGGRAREGQEEDEEEPWGEMLRNTIIRDLKGFGMEHAGPIGRSLISKVMSVSQDNYPEMVSERCPRGGVSLPSVSGLSSERLVRGPSAAVLAVPLR